MMRRLRLFILGLILVAPLTFAIGEKTFNWTPPTAYEDETPLPNQDITSYNIFCDGQLLTNVPNQPINTDTYQAAPGTFAVGTHTCHATTVVETTDVDGNLVVSESGPSNTVTFTVAPGVPKPPTLAVQ